MVINETQLHEMPNLCIHCEIHKILTFFCSFLNNRIDLILIIDTIEHAVY